MESRWRCRRRRSPTARPSPSASSTTIRTRSRRAARVSTAASPATSSRTRGGAPWVGGRVVLNDGKSHTVDSSDIAFQEAARAAWRDAYDRGKARVLEPIMRVVVEGPTEHSGGVLTTLMQRRGAIIGQQETGGMTITEADVPSPGML